ncbi:hypothetical protein Aple_003070 [Acrocarpospora pleiomorpha]|uniref:Uncharacterized protein n=1 Tax=Acrocarpospora pleiomorpha TaxID=90975 RepID=A0A5M3X9J7_9ACTN|nr:hypothetical protein [Acrocarpospora pleiomorpha]GES17412.1 hypothetical protein Aple_003070 [Acrocarpospora pleiomorpha]
MPTLNRPKGYGEPCWRRYPAGGPWLPSRRPDGSSRRRLGWGRHTVQRYARAATWQELVDGRWQNVRTGKLDPFKPHIHQRWDEGCTNARQIHREITSLGSRAATTASATTCSSTAPTEPPRPTVRQVTALLTRHPDRLTQDDELRGLRRILAWSCCCH